MTTNIVNLNKFRKAKTREDGKKRAEENRAKHGRTIVERTKDEDESARRDALLDGAKRDTADGDTGPDPGKIP